MSAPILLLDVDGVILTRRAVGPQSLKLSSPVGYIDRDIGERLYELDGLFDIVWCTGWEHYANDMISPLVGLARYPVVPLSTEHLDWVPRPYYDPELIGTDKDATRNSQTCWKLASVIQWLHEESLDDHPVAWLDDQIGQTDVKRWAQKRPNTKLVQTYEARGLMEREMRMLVDFAREQRLRGRRGV